MINEKKKYGLGAAGLAAILALTVAAGTAITNQREKERLAREESLLESSLAEEERVRLEKLASPELSDSQRELLDQLQRAVEQEDYEEAARLLLKQNERFWVLYYDVMGGRPYLYREGKLTDELEGEGLVLRKPSTVYAGELKDGKPDGQGTALQAIELSYPRYDYAVGQWKSGRMNGQGRTGYTYYEGAGEENREVFREGTFSDDCMDGEVHYGTVNADGERTEWTIHTEKGVIVPDENWRLDEERGVYQLPADHDASRAYVVAADSMDDILFRNVILWE